MNAKGHDNSKIRDLSCITTVGNRSICCTPY